MRHPFFADINFDTLRTEQTPPFVPDLEDDHDTSYFDSRELHDLSLFLEDGAASNRSVEMDRMAGLSNSPALRALDDPAYADMSAQQTAGELDKLLLSSSSPMPSRHKRPLTPSSRLSPMANGMPFDFDLNSSVAEIMAMEPPATTRTELKSEVGPAAPPSGRSAPVV